MHMLPICHALYRLFSAKVKCILLIPLQSERLHKVLEYVNEVHTLCGVLGMDFGKTVSEVHPSLQGTNAEQSTNISNATLEGLEQSILKLKAERKARIQKVRQIPALSLTTLTSSPVHTVKNYACSFLWGKKLQIVFLLFLPNLFTLMINPLLKSPNQGKGNGISLWQTYRIGTGHSFSIPLLPV